MRRQQPGLSAIRNWLEQPRSIAPLVTLRVVLGGMLLFSTLRFMYLGWIEDHYIRPLLHFKYYGFEWVEPLSAIGLYGVHLVLAISSLCVMLGWRYRLAAALQFVLFTYTELIDLTYYLNHYYFVSIAAALLMLAPAHRSFSLDVCRRPEIRLTQAPRWTVLMFQWQLGIVYFYAGIWKINSDWLLHALPLSIWVPANDALPILGWIFRQDWAPWAFSWIGMLYDVSIVFWLSQARTRAWAYLSVLVFHGLTGLMFQIGVFPLVMIGATLVFFSEEWHNRWQNRWRIWWQDRFFKKPERSGAPASLEPTPQWIWMLLTLHFAFQILFPWRYLLYPGNVFWTEQGYRFAWRVMLMEKAGTATFFVKDGVTGREGEVVNSEFLNSHQEKQMAMQPDLILQFAHFLKKHYTQKGVQVAGVRAEVYVTLNGRPSQLLIDPQTDLSQLQDNWRNKPWIIRYKAD
jgi:hypothetical protein